jgi:mannose-6-phosphate isomerase-like protein (cupin superfamily)
MRLDGQGIHSDGWGWSAKPSIADEFTREGKESHVGYKAINLSQKLGLIQEQWQPRVVAEMNDYQFKLVRIEGDFIWHDHKDTDETFLVLDGRLRIDFRDGAVHLSPGEMFVVPKGIEHKPYAENEVKLLLIEPRGVLNTGHEGGERTAANDVWI